MSRVYSFGNLDAWADVESKKLEDAVKGSLIDIAELMSRPIGALRFGTPFQEGFLPVDTSELFNSQAAIVGGARFDYGPASAPQAAKKYKLGDDTLLFFTALYARPIEYGWTTSTGKVVRGRYMVQEAVSHWREVVEQNVAYVKGES
jgi:hypothetical protein